MSTKLDRAREALSMADRLVQTSTGSSLNAAINALTAAQANLAAAEAEDEAQKTLREHIIVGPRGGRYYVAANGEHIYVGEDGQPLTRQPAHEEPASVRVRIKGLLDRWIAIIGSMGAMIENNVFDPEVMTGLLNQAKEVQGEVGWTDAGMRKYLSSGSIKRREMIEQAFPDRPAAAPAPAPAPEPSRSAPRPVPGRDPRIPPTGTTITRRMRGRPDLEVKVRDDGFEYLGRVYPSLGAISEVVSGAYRPLAWWGLDTGAATSAPAPTPAAPSIAREQREITAEGSQVSQRKLDVLRRDYAAAAQIVFGMEGARDRGEPVRMSAFDTAIDDRQKARENLAKTMALIVMEQERDMGLAQYNQWFVGSGNIPVERARENYERAQTALADARDMAITTPSPENLANLHFTEANLCGAKAHYAMVRDDRDSMLQAIGTIEGHIQQLKGELDTRMGLIASHEWMAEETLAAKNRGLARSMASLIAYLGGMRSAVLAEVDRIDRNASEYGIVPGAEPEQEPAVQPLPEQGTLEHDRVIAQAKREGAQLWDAVQRIRRGASTDILDRAILDLKELVRTAPTLENKALLLEKQTIATLRGIRDERTTQAEMTHSIRRAEVHLQEALRARNLQLFQKSHEALEALRLASQVVMQQDHQRMMAAASANARAARLAEQNAQPQHLPLPPNSGADMPDAGTEGYNAINRTVKGYAQTYWDGNETRTPETIGQLVESLRADYAHTPTQGNFNAVLINETAHVSALAKAGRLNPRHARESLQAAITLANQAEAQGNRAAYMAAKQAVYGRMLALQHVEPSAIGVRPQGSAPAAAGGLESMRLPAYAGESMPPTGSPRFEATESQARTVINNMWESASQTTMPTEGYKRAADSAETAYREHPTVTTFHEMLSTKTRLTIIQALRGEIDNLGIMETLTQVRVLKNKAFETGNVSAYVSAREAEIGLNRALGNIRQQAAPAAPSTPPTPSAAPVTPPSARPPVVGLPTAPAPGWERNLSRAREMLADIDDSIAESGATPQLRRQKEQTERLMWDHGYRPDGSPINWNREVEAAQFRFDAVANPDGTMRAGANANLYRSLKKQLKDTEMAAARIHGERLRAGLGASSPTRPAAAAAPAAPAAPAPVVEPAPAAAPVQPASGQTSFAPVQQSIVNKVRSMERLSLSDLTNVEITPDMMAEVVRERTKANDRMSLANQRMDNSEAGHIERRLALANLNIIVANQDLLDAKRRIQRGDMIPSRLVTEVRALRDRARQEERRAQNEQDTTVMTFGPRSPIVDAHEKLTSSKGHQLLTYEAIHRLLKTTRESQLRAQQQVERGQTPDGRRTIRLSGGMVDGGESGAE